jgi:hypothetical protein
MVFKTLVLFTIQPLDLADSLRELHYTQSPGKQQILHIIINLMNILVVQTTHKVLHFLKNSSFSNKINPVMQPKNNCDYKINYVTSINK